VHPEAYDFVRRVAHGRYFNSVIEIGSRNINGSVRSLISTDDYWGIDLYAGPGVDEVADATEWIADPPVHCVICCEVLEHAPDIDAILHSVSASLVPVGVFIMTCATDPRMPHSTHDGGTPRPDEHYQNVDPAEFQRMAEVHDLEVTAMEVHQDRGDLYVIARKITT